MYRIIFFDLDGTLTDSREGIFSSVSYAIAQIGSPALPEETLLRFIGPPLQDSFMRYCGYDADTALRAVRLFREVYLPTGQFQNRAAPGMAELCARLKAQGRTLAVASSKPEELCRAICNRFSFSASMDVISGSPPSAVDCSKADVIRTTMRRMGLTERDLPRILMVGDRKFDVLGATEVGIDCVGVEFFGYAEEGELEQSGAVAVVKTPEELEAFLLSH